MKLFFSFSRHLSTGQFRRGVLLSDNEMKANILARYKERISDFGYTEESLGWHVGTSQVRYKMASKFILDNQITNVLDIGCGLGGLLRELRNHDWNGRYVGLDLVPEFIEQCKLSFLEYDNSDFYNVANVNDFLEYEGDHVVALGLMNHRDLSNEVLRERFLNMISMSAKHSFTIDFLCPNSNLKSHELSYQDINVLANWCDQQNYSWKLNHDYLKYEFSLHCKKNLYEKNARIYSDYLRD